LKELRGSTGAIGCSFYVRPGLQWVEVSYCLHAAKRLEYLDEALHRELDRALRKVAAPLLGLIRKRRVAGQDDDPEPRPRLTRRTREALSAIPTRTK
jgi:hypothetical protein